MNSNESTSSNTNLDNISIPHHNCCNNTIVQQELNKNNNTKKSNGLTLLAQNFRRGRSLNFTNKRVRSKCGKQVNKEITTNPSSSTISTNSTSNSSSNSSSSSSSSSSCGSITKNKSPKWVTKFNCAKKERTCNTTEDNRDMKCCVCTCYRRTEEHHLGAGVVFQQQQQQQQQQEQQDQVLDNSQYSDEGATGDSNVVREDVVEVQNEKETENNFDNRQAIIKIIKKEEIQNVTSNSDVYGNLGANNSSIPVFEVSWVGTFQFPADDCDEQARLQRAREIAEGIEPPANFKSVRQLHLVYPPDIDQLEGSSAPRRLQLVCPPDLTVDSLKALFQTQFTLRSGPLDAITGCHTQIDYIHCLVPDLLSITNCSFYWGKMDRYEAEKLLENKDEGTFLLRDSAQEEFLFSVSFRKYSRSLHARIEQWNHKFSFDSHDPSVFSSETVCGLIEHYKDPSSCMFFEPMLTRPLHRNFTFSLQHLCRAVITSRLNYDDVNQLQLPKSLKSYLKEYHYRQKVRVERFDDDLQWIDLRNTSN